MPSRTRLASSKISPAWSAAICSSRCSSLLKCAARATRTRSWISACEAAGQQTLGRGPEYEAQELQRLGAAQHVAQAVAEMHR